MFALTLTLNTYKDNYLASVLSTEMVHANANVKETISGYDADPNDKCFSAETGELLASDCEPSTFWDTCEK